MLCKVKINDVALTYTVLFFLFLPTADGEDASTVEAMDITMSSCTFWIVEPFMYGSDCEELWDGGGRIPFALFLCEPLEKPLTLADLRPSAEAMYR